jgi:preprotein translocase subunit SecG
METALYILHVLVCLAMLPIILLQSGKGGGVSAVFGGGGSSNVFGSRGASNFLTRMTTAAAIIFMCTSMGLSYVSSQSRSVIGEDLVPAPAPAPEQGGMAPAPDDGSAAPADEGGGLDLPLEPPEPADE